MKPRALVRSVFITLALTLAVSLPLSAANFVTKAVVGSGNHWNNQTVWSNPPSTAVSLPVAGNTYEMLFNGTAFGNNQSNTRMRNPPADGLQTFPGDSLTMNTNTEFRFKRTTAGAIAPAVSHFPGVGGAPGLIMNGGVLGAGDDSIFIVTGRVHIASRAVLTGGDNGGGGQKIGRGIFLRGWLTGTGEVAVIQSYPETFMPQDPDASGFTGRWLVQNGALRFLGTNSTGAPVNSAGAGSVVVAPTNVLAAANATNYGKVEFMYDWNASGGLFLSNNPTSGSPAVCLLHQNLRVGALVINGAAFGAGTYTWAQLNATYPANFPAGGSGSITVVTPAPLVNVSTPADNTHFYNPASGIAFTLTSGTPMFTNNITLLLNGSNASSGLVVSGDDTNASVTYNGLAADTFYSATIIASNASSSVTRNFTFDTFTLGTTFVIEAEDYNYGDGDCSVPSSPFDSVNGGLFHDNPTPGQYQNAIAAAEVDYHDNAVTRGDAVLNAYRLCDYVGTRTNTDTLHPPFTGGGFPDFDVAGVQSGEWLNYTRTVPAGTYAVYLRAASSANNTFQLDRVGGNVSGPASGQTLFPAGTFTVPNTVGAYRTFPLKDMFGNVATITFSGSPSTLRLTALNANTNVQVSYLVFVKQTTTRPPALFSVSPAPNATGIYPDVVTRATIVNGDTQVNPATMVVKFNGVDVTAGASITSDANGVVVSYDPPGFLTGNTTYTVSLEYQDNAGSPASFSNAWSFTTINIPTIPTSYATASGSATDAGFNIRIRKAPNTAPAATFGTTILRAEQQLADAIIDPATGAPYPNEAAAGSTVEPGVINYEQAAATNAGAFNGTNGYQDLVFPGIPAGDPRWTNDPNYIALEATAYLELPVGIHKLAVRSDDGYKVTAGPVFSDTNLVLSFLDAGRGDAATEFEFVVVSNGVYAFRLLYFEGGGGASLEFYSVNRTNGVRTLINDSLVGTSIRAYRTRATLPPATPPQIVNISPANNTFFYNAAGGISFEALAGAGNTIAPADVHLTLNGTDVSASLTVGGTSSDRTASYSGLAPNSWYRAVISVTDSASRTSTRTVAFDTFTDPGIVTVEVEDYNYADVSCPSPAVIGGNYQDPVTVDGYRGFYGLPGIDYADASSNSVNNAYRPCDFVGTSVSLDGLRPAYAGTNDFVVNRFQPGDWMNYTRLSWAGFYKVYLRVAATAPRQLTLAKVNGDPSNPGQGTRPLGLFNVPNTTANNSFTYVPLTDVSGNEVSVGIDGFDTVRLTSVNANNDVSANFLLFLPAASGNQPYIVSASPAAGATKVPVTDAVNIVIADGVTAANVGSIVLTVDGTNVTAESTISSSSGVTTVNYLPPTLWATGAVHTVRVVFQDNAGSPATISNQWSFTSVAGTIGFPVKVNFAAGAGNSAGNPVAPTPPGYMQDIGEAFGNRGNGFTYGWDRNIVADGRYRQSANSPDVRFDTFMHMIKATPPAVWEVAIPNGTYDVRVVGGDPTAADSLFQFDVEGTITPTYTVVVPNYWADFTVTTTVSDGRLTLRSGPQSQTTTHNNKVCFIDIVPPITPVAPVVTRNPAPLTVDAGQQAQFSVLFRGTESLTYQWYHGGNPVPGGNGPTLTIPSAQVGDAGAYSIAITNNAGGAVSATAQLTVNSTTISNLVLNVSRDTTNIVVSWTNTATGVLLETTNLNPPVTWTTNTASVVETNGNKQVTIPATDPIRVFKFQQ